MLTRAEPCSFCGHPVGQRIAKVDYWNLQSGDFVQCEKCRHTQLDPKLSAASTEMGCKAYYLKEIIEINKHEQFRNLLRSFRRGVLFAWSLQRRGLRPRKVLEIGPGSGYFLDGFKFVFPDVEITVLDIVDEVLKSCQQVHGYKTIKALPDADLGFVQEKFDLIIARDLIEHVNDPRALFDNVRFLLSAGGLFHFITPNGYEDVWGHHLVWSLQGRSSELLINHVNYFDGDSLATELKSRGFSSLEYYTYQFKNFLKGKGWKKVLKWSQASRQLAPEVYLAEPAPVYNFSKEDVHNQWYISQKLKWLTYFVCWYHHGIIFKLSPSRRIGHEIFGLFQKQ